MILMSFLFTDDTHDYSIFDNFYSRNLNMRLVDVLAEPDAGSHIHPAMHPGMVEGFKGQWDEAKPKP